MNRCASSLAALAALSLTLATGGSSATAQSQPAQCKRPLDREPQALVNPPDLMTDVRNTPAEVTVLREFMGADEVARVQAAIGLVTWPEGREVPGKVAVEQVADDGPPRYVFRFVPEARLEGGWHAVRIQPAAGLKPEGTHREPDGAHVARFRADSQPVVRSVTFGPSQKEVGVRLVLSERVRDPRRAHQVARLAVNGKPHQCQDGPGDALQSAEGTLVLQLLCQPFALDNEVAISLGTVRGLGGRPLQFAFGEATLARFNPGRDPVPETAARVYEAPAP